MEVFIVGAKMIKANATRTNVIKAAAKLPRPRKKTRTTRKIPGINPTEHPKLNAWADAAEPAFSN